MLTLEKSGRIRRERSVNGKTTLPQASRLSTMRHRSIKAKSSGIPERISKWSSGSTVIARDAPSGTSLFCAILTPATRQNPGTTNGAPSRVLKLPNSASTSASSSPVSISARPNGSTTESIARGPDQAAKTPFAANRNGCGSALLPVCLVLRARCWLRFLKVAATTRCTRLASGRGNDLPWNLNSDFPTFTLSRWPLLGLSNWVPFRLPDMLRVIKPIEASA
jgi:hypothetical protein